MNVQKFSTLRVNNEHHAEHLIASKQNTNNSLSAFDATELKLEQNK